MERNETNTTDREGAHYYNGYESYQTAPQTCHQQPSGSGTQGKDQPPVTYFPSAYDEIFLDTTARPLGSSHESYMNLSLRNTVHRWLNIKEIGCLQFLPGTSGTSLGNTATPPAEADFTYVGTTPGAAEAESHQHVSSTSDPDTQGNSPSWSLSDQACALSSASIDFLRENSQNLDDCNTSETRELLDVANIQSQELPASGVPELISDQSNYSLFCLSPSSDSVDTNPDKSLNGPCPDQSSTGKLNQPLHSLPALSNVLHEITSILTDFKRRMSALDVSQLSQVCDVSNYPTVDRTGAQSTAFEAVPGLTTHPAVIPGSHALSATVPASHTYPAAFPGSHTYPATFPGSHTNPATFPGSHTYRAMFRASHTYPATFPGSHIYRPTVVGSYTYPTAFPGSHTYQATFPGSYTYQATFPGSHTYQTTFPGSNTHLSTFLTSNISPATLPGSNTHPATFPGSNTHPATFPASNTHPAKFSGSHTPPAVAPGSHRLSEMVAGSDTLPAVVPGSDTLSAVVPGSNTLPAVVPGSNTLPAVVPGSDILPAVFTGSDNLPAVVPGSDTLPAVVPGSDTLPAVVPSSDTLPAVVPGSDNLPAVVPGSDNLPAVVPGSDNLPAVVPGSDNLPAMVPRSDNLPAMVPESDTLPTAVPESCIYNTVKGEFTQNLRPLDNEPTDDVDNQLKNMKTQTHISDADFTEHQVLNLPKEAYVGSKPAHTNTLKAMTKLREELNKIRYENKGLKKQVKDLSDLLQKSQTEQEKWKTDCDVMSRDKEAQELKHAAEVADIKKRLEAATVKPAHVQKKKRGNRK